VGAMNGGGVGVLGVEIGDDFGRVLVAHPAVVVVEGDAVEGGGGGIAAGYGRLGGQGRFAVGRWGGTFLGGLLNALGRVYTDRFADDGRVLLLLSLWG
jgi:hypothetical protein